ncbi:MAG: branched-chain amino acid ABC transporter permease [Betaproteobacteria bacterium]|nr:branched-chain amino acid ABC transporter permease [Betaproteobacteria bacterium]MDH4325039.1 branched-chain amino acid ABC transporter permease [Betaproteobacteria bacterium]MDH5210970.1 branched-chain amino acid ABC transporter permease [Betaproteobacteria bacterium]MDH5578726.1 branched-chain amino acid ABC transporter permease [Betaproteobacteria bacterium]
MISADLFSNAVVSGLLLGGFYAAVAIGLAIVFGQLDIVNIAHPAFIIVGAYIAYILNSRFGFDPVFVGLLAAPAFFVVGAVIYRVYFLAFERTGQESLSGLAFFFGVMFIIEVVLILIYGVDYRLVQADYIGQSWRIGFVDFPLRMLVPFAVAAALTAAIYVFMSRTFMGRAIQAVAQDRLALQLMGADPVRIKQWAFGLGIATAAIAGSLLIVIGPVEPSVGRLYIGRAFAIVVLGGMGSIKGMFIAALILGIVESMVSTFAGPSWSPAVAFGVLAITLALRPAGLFGRR